MSLEWELYEEKRRKLRRSSFFRGIFFTLALLVVGVVIFLWRSEEIYSPHIAVYDLEGVIFDDFERDNILNEIADDDKVLGMILRINSPGGSVVGAEAVYGSVRTVARKKPVVVTMGEVAASAGYIAALGGDHIIARGNSLTGSIGVIVQYPNLSKLAETIGISIEEIKSSEAKGSMNPLKKMDTVNRVFQEQVVQDSFVWFKKLVSQRRGLSKRDIAKVSQGQLLTGRMALRLDLIDAIGGIPEAIKYFESKDPKFIDIELRDWTISDDFPPFWVRFFGIKNIISFVNKLSSESRPSLFSIVS